MSLRLLIKKCSFSQYIVDETWVFNVFIIFSFYRFLMNFLWSQNITLRSLYLLAITRQCQTVPISVFGCIFTVNTRSVSGFKSLPPPPPNHSPELHMVSYCQLNICIWMLCRDLKTHDESLSVRVIYSFYFPNLFFALNSLFRVHHSRCCPSLNTLFLDSSIAFTPPVSHQVLICLLFTSLFLPHPHCHYVRASYHCVTVGPAQATKLIFQTLKSPCQSDLTKGVDCVPLQLDVPQNLIICAQSTMWPPLPRHVTMDWPLDNSMI